MCARTLILGNWLNYSRVWNRIMGWARIWLSRVRLTSVSSPNRFIVRRKVPSILTDSVCAHDTPSPTKVLYIRHLRITLAVAQVRCRTNLRPLINILPYRALESTLYDFRDWFNFNPVDGHCDLYHTAHFSNVIYIYTISHSISQFYYI